ncbi:MAG: hypothetical protein COA79_12215 [Planctomycetota bacterium]|nr:MAG: hypothetical protein COA79_12215 [Planctomycetota bacterium]
MNKKALITWGGWDGHEPDSCAKIVKEILEKENYSVEVYDTLEVYEDSENLKSLDLIVPIWTMSEISNEQEKGLLNAILSGTGIGGFHGGMGDSFRKNTEYQWMVGGQWVVHPGGIIDYSVQISSDDAIVEGIKDFKMQSEQYFMHTDPGNDVLATTTFSGIEGNAPWIAETVMPVVWKRQYGKGKVFYSSLGHVAKDFEVPEMKEILRRGLLWATR